MMPQVHVLIFVGNKAELLGSYRPYQQVKCCGHTGINPIICYGVQVGIRELHRKKELCHLGRKSPSQLKAQKCLPLKIRLDYFPQKINKFTS